MAKVIDKQSQGYKNFRKAIEEIDGMRADVGFWGNAKEDDGTPVVQVAAFNVYGTEHAPPRDFMGRTVDTKSDQIYQHALSDARKVIAGKKSGKYILKSAVILMHRLMKETIRDAPNWAVPNARSVQERKGGKATPVNMPLIDTHIMISNLRWRLRKSGEEGK